MYTELIANAYPQARLMAPPLLAGAVGRLALSRARRGEFTAPAGLHPLYVRRPDAELTRDRALRGGGA